ncbi:GSCOCG00004004001-RA-CDS, partial [Cotesia congregata]
IRWRNISYKIHTFVCWIRWCCRVDHRRNTWTYTFASFVIVRFRLTHYH